MASASIGDPQSLNLFAYVGNNPVDFVDSIGLEKHFPGFLDWLYEEKGIAYAGNGKDMYGNDVDIDIGMFIEFTRTLDENPNCILNANPGSRLTTDPHEMIVPKLRWENGRFVEDPSANDHDGVHIVNPTPGESNFMALPSMKGKVLHYGIQSFNEPYVSVLDISIEASVDGDPLVLTIKDMSWKKRAYSRNQKIKSGQILGVVTSRRNFKGEISEASGAHVTLMTLSTYKKYIAGRQSGAARRSVPVSELIDVYNDSRSPFNCP